MIQICCICGYAGIVRTFRNVGTPEHPNDMVCHLCDTQEVKQ